MTADLLVLAVVIAIEPLPLIGYLVLLDTDGGARRGAGFIIGWIASLVAVIALSLTMTGGTPLKTNSAPANSVLAAKLLIGIALLWVARSRRAHRDRPKRPPTWLAKMGQVSFPTAMSFGCLLQPWGLVAAAALEVTNADLSDSATTVTLVAFCLLATSSYFALQGYAMARPKAASARLSLIRAWIERNTDPAIIILSGGVGLWLTASSIYLLLR